MSTEPIRSSKSAQFRMLAVLIAVACMDMLGFAMIFPLLTFYALDFNISPFGLGIVIASFSLAQLLASPVWGRFSDRYGRRPAILISLGASAVSFVVFGFAGSFWGLLLVSGDPGSGRRNHGRAACLRCRHRSARGPDAFVGLAFGGDFSRYDAGARHRFDRLGLGTRRTGAYRRQPVCCEHDFCLDLAQENPPMPAR